MHIRLSVVGGALVGVLVCATMVSAQTPPPRPVPFPTAGAAAASIPEAQPPQAPLDAALGAPMYPAAVFLETIDAGKGGQQYHLYGTDAPYVDIVNYFKTTLKQGGRTIFQAPAMHQFELGRFQEQTMAYPPSIVVKDYLWNGSEGYLHAAGTTQRRYRTIIQVVPATVK
jgi:hypothetical protein